MEKIYGSLGRKMSHSWSVPIHNALGCDVYKLYEKEPEEIADFLARDDIGGLSVTMPYKRTVMPYCDVIDDAAQAIGCVNTLSRRADGKLYAWNTDAVGFCFTAKRAGIDFSGKKVVVLGSGGASLTAQAMSRKMGAREVVVISRSGPNNYNNLELHADADIVVNATPVGMFPNTGKAAVDLRSFPKCTGVFDIVYNPCRTALLLQAEELGIPHTGGLPMLVEQAVAGEEHFFQKTFPEGEVDRVLAILRRDCMNMVLLGEDAAPVAEALNKLTGHKILTAKTLEEAQEIGKQPGSILVAGEEALCKEWYPNFHQNGKIYHLAAGGGWEPNANVYRDVVLDSNLPAEELAQIIWDDFRANPGN